MNASEYDAGYFGLITKLFRVQQNMPSILKTEVNSHFGNAYVSLDGVLDIVLPVLHGEGLFLMQFPTTLDGAPALRTTIIDTEGGRFMEDTMLLVLAKDDPQGQGSALTYAKRYALLSMLGLTADKDDDGEGAQKAAPKKRSNVTTIGEGDYADDHQAVGYRF